MELPELLELVVGPPPYGGSGRFRTCEDREDCLRERENPPPPSFLPPGPHGPHTFYGSPHSGPHGPRGLGDISMRSALSMRRGLPGWALGEQLQSRWAKLGAAGGRIWGLQETPQGRRGRLSGCRGCDRHGPLERQAQQGVSCQRHARCSASRDPRCNHVIATRCIIPLGVVVPGRIASHLSRPHHHNARLRITAPQRASHHSGAIKRFMTSATPVHKRNAPPSQPQSQTCDLAPLASSHL